MQILPSLGMPLVISTNVPYNWAKVRRGLKPHGCSQDYTFRVESTAKI